jgi:hypothetical protein
LNTSNRPPLNIKDNDSHLQLNYIPFYGFCTVFENMLAIFLAIDPKRFINGDGGIE